jgi:hypothetical protein
MATQRTRKRPSGELRPEYDFSQLHGGVRGTYYQRARARGNIVLLDPELSKLFPTSEAVNDALRTLVAAARTSVPQPRRSKAKPA